MTNTLQCDFLFLTMSVISETASYLFTASSRLDLQPESLDLGSADTPMPRDKAQMRP